MYSGEEDKRPSKVFTDDSMLIAETNKVRERIASKRTFELKPF